MRKLAWLAFAFSGAVFLSVYCLSAGAALAAGAALFFCAAALLLWRRTGRWCRAARYAVCGLCAGFLWFGAFSGMVYDRAARLDGQSGGYVVTAVDFPEQTDYGWRLEGRVQGISPLPVRCRVYGDDLAGVTPGDVLRVSGRCTRSDVMHGAHTDVFTAKGVFLFLYADEPVEVEQDAGVSLRWAPQYLAQSMRAMVREIFPPETAALFLAILTGDKAALYTQPVLLSDFRIAGVYHILVVSGMHLSFLTGLLTLLFGKRKHALLLSVPVLFLFAAMAGLTASVVRALIMQLFVIGAALFDRESDSLTALAAALALLLVFNPYAAAGAGLQLSFAATLGIVLLADPLFKKMYAPLKDKRFCARKPMRRLVTGVLSLLAASVGANVLTVPLAALYYGSVSLIAPVTNLLTVWAFSAAFSLGFIACLCGFVWLPLGSAAAWCAAVPMLYARFAVQKLAKLPCAALYTQNSFVVLWLCFVYLLLVLALRFRKTRRLALPAALAVVSLCVLLVSNVYAGRADRLRVTVLDVGQGQCVVLTSDDAAAVVDCGSLSGTDAGGEAAAYLLSRGVNAVEVMIFTHCDADHINGFETLAARLPVGAVILPPAQFCDADGRENILNVAQAHGVDVLASRAQMEIELDRAQLRIIPPVRAGTNSGLCVLGTAGDFDVLLTGDLDAAGERALLQRTALPDIELLIAGHHGSKNATSAALLQALKPETAVISVGYNTYGHPAPETLARLYACCTAVYRTDEDGTVTVAAE